MPAGAGVAAIIAVILFYLGLVWYVGAAAEKRGRSALSFIVLSLFTTPLFSYVVLLVIGSDTRTEDLRTGKLGRCPACAEWIQNQASRCHYCGEQLQPGWGASSQGLSKTHLYEARGLLFSSFLLFGLSFVLFSGLDSPRAPNSEVSLTQDSRPQRTSSLRNRARKFSTGKKSLSFAKGADKAGQESIAESTKLDSSRAESTKSGPTPAGKQIELDIHATGECLAKFYSDGDLVWEGKMHSGEARQVLATFEVSIWVDNAAAVYVRFNGREQPPLGSKGESVKRTFKAGL